MTVDIEYLKEVINEADEADYDIEGLCTWRLRELVDAYLELQTEVDLLRDEMRRTHEAMKNKLTPSQQLDVILDSMLKKESS